MALLCLEGGVGAGGDDSACPMFGRDTTERVFVLEGQCTSGTLCFVRYGSVVRARHPSLSALGSSSQMASGCWQSSAVCMQLIGDLQAPTPHLPI